MKRAHDQLVDWTRRDLLSRFKETLLPSEYHWIIHSYWVLSQIIGGRDFDVLRYITQYYLDQIVDCWCECFGYQETTRHYRNPEWKKKKKMAGEGVDFRDFLYKEVERDFYSYRSQAIAEATKKLILENTPIQFIIALGYNRDKDGKGGIYTNIDGVLSEKWDYARLYVPFALGYTAVDIRNRDSVREYINKEELRDDELDSLIVTASESYRQSLVQKTESPVFWEFPFDHVMYDFLGKGGVSS